MGRKVLHLEDGHYVVLGYDRPFCTLFAALYEGRHADGEPIPSKAVGYHPAEQGATPPGTDYGPYPCDWATFDQTLREWGLTGEQREEAGRMIAIDKEIL